MTSTSENPGMMPFYGVQKSAILTFLTPLRSSHRCPFALEQKAPRPVKRILYGLSAYLCYGQRDGLIVTSWIYNTFSSLNVSPSSWVINNRYVLYALALSSNIFTEHVASYRSYR